MNHTLERMGEPLALPPRDHSQFQNTEFGALESSPFAPLVSRPGDFDAHPMLYKASGIGDLASTDKGSGARFNSGKPDLSLIPLTMLSGYLAAGEEPTGAVAALECLGLYQSIQDTAVLFKLLEVLGPDGWEECAHVFDYGKRKYAAWNWAKGMPWSVPLACAARHLLAMTTGETIDRESGLPHRGHVFCNVVMLLQYSKTYAEGNDLPPKGML